MYTLILTTFYNYAPESVFTVDMDPVENIQAAEVATSDICEAANNALGNGFLIAALTIDPTFAKKLSLSKCFFLDNVLCT